MALAVATEVAIESQSVGRPGVTSRLCPNQDADGIWPAPSGALVAWFRDPDGHVLALTQFRMPSFNARGG